MPSNDLKIFALTKNSLSVDSAKMFLKIQDLSKLTHTVCPARTLRALGLLLADNALSVG